MIYREMVLIRHLQAQVIPATQEKQHTGLSLCQ